jgi:hypothetical protein
VGGRIVQLPGWCRDHFQLASHSIPETKSGLVATIEISNLDTDVDQRRIEACFINWIFRLSGAECRFIRSEFDFFEMEIEIELWFALSTRLQDNYQHMRQNGVLVDSSPAPAVVAALQSGAAAAQRAWCTRSGPVCPQILDAFKAGKP